MSNVILFDFKLIIMMKKNMKLFFGIFAFFMLFAISSCTKVEQNEVHAEEAIQNGLYVEEIIDILEYFETFQSSDQNYNNYVSFYLDENNQLDYDDHWEYNSSTHQVSPNEWDYSSKNRLKAASWADEQISNGKYVIIGKTEDGVYWDHIIDHSRN